MSDPRSADEQEVLDGMVRSHGAAYVERYAELILDQARMVGTLPPKHEPVSRPDLGRDVTTKGVAFQFFVGPLEFAVPPRPDVPMPQFTEERVLAFFAHERGQAWVDANRQAILAEAKKIGVLAPQD